MSFRITNSLDFDGTFSAKGTSGSMEDDSGGHGCGSSGGSVRIEAKDVKGICVFDLSGGAQQKTGSVGRSAINYSGTFAALALAPAYLDFIGSTG